MLPARGGQLQDSVGLVCNAHRSPRVVVSFPAHRQRWQAPSGAPTLCSHPARRGWLIYECFLMPLAARTQRLGREIRPVRAERTETVCAGG